MRNTATVRAGRILASVVIWAAACGSTESKGGDISDDARLTILDAVADEAVALITVNPNAGAPELEAILSRHPEFVRVGATDDGTGAVGTWRDGRVLLLENQFDWPIDDTAPMQLRDISPDPAPRQVPKDRTATFSNPAQFSSRIASWYQWTKDAEYLASLVAGTVEDFKAVRGVGVFYVDAHGGFAKDSGTYALWTSTAVNKAGEAKYKEDLDNGLLIQRPVVRRGANGKPTKLKLYGFTPKFVRKFMSFSPNSFVFVNGCHSLDSDMMAAFLAQGASVYAGWDAEVKWNTQHNCPNETGDYVFSRLLGSNDPNMLGAAKAEMPPQRPFTVALLPDDMAKKTLTRCAVPPNATFAFRSPTPGFGLLSPSLKYVGLEYAGKVLLYGSFGSSPGTVTVSTILDPNGTTDPKPRELAGCQWLENLVICDLPTDAVGHVRVNLADGRQSNARQITEWRGTFTFTGLYTVNAGYGAGPRTLKATFKWSLRFRGDVGAFRDKPGQAPAQVRLEFTPESDSTASAAAEGQSTYSVGIGTETDRWSGSGSVPWDSSSVSGIGVIDPASHLLKLNLSMSNPGSVIKYQTTLDATGEVIATGDAPAVWWVGDDGFQDGVDDWAQAVINIPMAADWSIPAGQKSHQATSDDSPTGTLQWDVIQPLYPPDPTTGR